MDVTSLVGRAATVVGILCFGSGLPLCRRIYRQRSTRDIAYPPLVSGCFCTFVWLQYGLAKPDGNVLAVNAFGLVLQAFYVLSYYYYTEDPWATGMLAMLGTLMGCVAGCVRLADPASAEMALGRLGSVMTVVAAASPLLSIRRVLQTGSSSCLPFAIIVSTFLSSLLWTLYGILLGDANIYSASGFALCIAAFQLLLCAWYPSGTITKRPQ